jgi:hypothetical protein
MRRHPYQDLTEVPNICNHPKEHCTETDADVMGMFYYRCKLCGQTFTRYMEFPKYRKDHIRFE